MGYSYLLRDRRLAQGSAPPSGVSVPFDGIVLAALEYQPELPAYAVLRVPLDDPFPPKPPPDARTVALIRAGAQQVASEVRAGRRVLVTCAQGRNRSGVLAGLALVELGMPGQQAAALIRRLRGGLTNPYFWTMVNRSRPLRLGG